MVREHDPLGNAGRARGEDQRSQRILVNLRVKVGTVARRELFLARLNQLGQLVKADARYALVDTRDLLCGFLGVKDSRCFGDLCNVDNLLCGNFLVNGHNNAHAADDRHICGDPRNAVLTRHNQTLAAKAARKQLGSQCVDILRIGTEAEVLVCPVHFFHEQRLVAEFLGARIEHFFQVFVDINRIILVLRH